MSRGRIAFAMASLLCLMVIASAAFPRSSNEPEEGEDSLYRYLTVFSEVLNLVRRTYVDPPDLDSLFAGALNGAVDALDPFATYVPADDAEAISSQLDAEYLISGMRLAAQRGITFVAAVAPGSSAFEAGIEVGDVVAELNGASTRNMPLWEAQKVLSGEPGTSIAMELIRQGQSRDVDLNLATFEMPQPTQEDREEAVLLRIAYFGSETRDHVKTILGELVSRDVRKLLLDLRGSYGSDPRLGYDLAELFVEGKLGSLVQRGETVERFERLGEVTWSGDLVVLVDRGSIGPGEVLAEVLRQTAGAQLVGEVTFGHAGRRALAELSGGALLVYTDAYYTASDAETIDQGLKPDVVVRRAPRTYSRTSVPLEDRILERGLEVLVEPAEVAAEREAA